MATCYSAPQGPLEMVQCNVAGCKEELPRQDLPIHLTNHLSRMSEEFARLRQGMEKKIEDLEQELDRKRCLEEDMRLVMQESKTHFAQRDKLRQEVELTKEDLVQTRQVAEQIHQMATREDLAVNQQRVVEQVQQMATRQDVVRTQEETRQVAEQVRLMATQQELAQTQHTVRQTQEGVGRLMRESETHFAQRDEIRQEVVHTKENLVHTRQLALENHEQLVERYKKQIRQMAQTQRTVDGILVFIASLFIAYVLMSPSLQQLEDKQTMLWSMLTNMLPVKIPMNRVTRYQDHRTVWYSEPFYTRFHGYKMCLRVDANGSDMGTGTHLSVFLHMMRGEFDDSLDWPFETTIRIEVLSLSGKWKNPQVGWFSSSSKLVFQRVTAGERAEVGQGYPQYLSHSELQAYRNVEEDSVTFRVTAW